MRKASGTDRKHWASGPSTREKIMSEQTITAEDLMELGYGDDPFLLEDPSLCTLCSWTSSSK